MTATSTTSKTKILVAVALCSVAAAAALAVSALNTNTTTKTTTAYTTTSGGGVVYGINNFIGAQPDPQSVPKKFLGMASAMGNTCVILADTTVRCWGQASAAAGVNPAAYTDLYASVVDPRQIFQNDQQPLSNVKSIVGILDHGGFCAVKNDGTVWCWGTTPQQWIGNQDPLPSTFTPWLAEKIMASPGVALSQVTRLEAGGVVCALKADQTAWCWAPSLSNMFIGAGGIMFGKYPIQVMNELNNGPLRAIIDMAGGEDTMCFLTSLNNVKKTLCMGSGHYGGLGNGGYNTSLTVVPVLDPGIANQPFLNNKRIFGGKESVRCAVDVNDRVACWGGRVWNVTFPNNATFPKNIATPEYLFNSNNQIVEKAVALGSSHEDNNYNCVLKSDGTVWCWGINNLGQLGDGTKVSSLDKAVQMKYNGQPVVGITRMVVGTLNTCVMWMDNQVACLGDNMVGELGNDVDHRTVQFSTTLLPVHF